MELVLKLEYPNGGVALDNSVFLTPKGFSKHLFITDDKKSNLASEYAGLKANMLKIKM